MTKEERNERNQHIINDIKAGMTNAQITEKYGIAERTIQRILDGERDNHRYIENVAPDVFDDEVVDIQEENDRLQEQIELMQKAFNSELANLTAKFSKLESDTARINTATIGYIAPDEDHYIIGVKQFDDNIGIPLRAYNLKEALELFEKYRPMMSKDQVMDTLKKYGHTNRDCGKIYFKASAGSNIDDHEYKFREIDTRLDNLEERLLAIEEQ